MLEPRFSIVIACYNQEKFVREAVESVLSQDCSSCEIIAVDDASRDGTAEMLRSFGERIIFAPLEQNLGAGGARNYGAALARGEYLVFLDGDDALSPWALDVYGTLVERQPIMILAHAIKCFGALPSAATTTAPDEIRFVEYGDFFEKDRPWVYNSSSLIVKRSAFRAAGGWTPEIFYQDIQDLLNKLGVAGKTILVQSPETVWYRMHGTNAVSKVLPFVKAISLLRSRAHSGVYPGDRWARLRRSAWFGGLAFYWVKQALVSGLAWDATKLLASSWWLIGLAVVRRSLAWTLGRSPVEKIPLVMRKRQVTLTRS